MHPTLRSLTPRTVLLALITATHGMVTPPGTPDGGPDGSVEQMHYVFHELHADGRHPLCAVCGNQRAE